MAKKGRRRQDHLARRAQSEGYHARSVYKLEALDQKFRLFKSNPRALDLGAAPGSWSQYAVAHGADVVAVDLQEFSIAGVDCIIGDFTDSDIAGRIMATGPFEVVLSDAAPATTGNKVVDTGRSEALVESILTGLPAWLIPGGTMVAKLFQGGGEQRLRQAAQSLFTTVSLFRPNAVRRESFETYLVGIGYKGEK